MAGAVAVLAGAAGRAGAAVGGAGAVAVGAGGAGRARVAGIAGRAGRVELDVRTRFELPADVIALLPRQVPTRQEELVHIRIIAEREVGVRGPIVPQAVIRQQRILEQQQQPQPIFPPPRRGRQLGRVAWRGQHQAPRRQQQQHQPVVPQPPRGRQHGRVARRGQHPAPRRQQQQRQRIAVPNHGVLDQVVGVGC